MGENSFILFGFLSDPRRNKSAEDPLTTLKGDLYVQLSFQTGPETRGEKHTILVTGTAANLAYAALQKEPEGFLALAKGQIKTIDGVAYLIVTYVENYRPGAWVLENMPHLARV